MTRTPPENTRRLTSRAMGPQEGISRHTPVWDKTPLLLHSAEVSGPPHLSSSDTCHARTTTSIARYKKAGGNSSSGLRKLNGRADGGQTILQDDAAAHRTSRFNYLHIQSDSSYHNIHHHMGCYLLEMADMPNRAEQVQN